MQPEDFERSDRPEDHPEDFDDRGGIDRGSTLLRVLLTVLFAVIWSVLETVLGLVVIVSLLWTLITRQPPPPRLREFSNWLVSYAYRIWRYVTYNDARVPFPFSELPAPLEQPTDLGFDDASEVRELLPRADDEDRELS